MRKEFHVAPMIDVSYRDFRGLMRCFTKEAVIWTEMLVSNGLVHAASGKVQSTVQSMVEGQFPSSRPESFDGLNPSVVQIGGNDEILCGEAARILSHYGFREINLNCGCPSDRVSGKGQFGASLMKNPEKVRDILYAMKKSVPTECRISVKTRIGVDNFDSDEFFQGFIGEVSKSCDNFYVHSRKCILQGLSCSENRRIPPLRYDAVFRACEKFPDLNFTINGGFTSTQACYDILHSEKTPKNLVGVMAGRMAYEKSTELCLVDSLFYGHPKHETTYSDLVNKYSRYLELQYSGNEKISSAKALKPITYLFQGVSHGKKFRRDLNEISRQRKFDLPHEILRDAVTELPDFILQTSVFAESRKRKSPD